MYILSNLGTKAKQAPKELHCATALGTKLENVRTAQPRHPTSANRCYLIARKRAIMRVTKQTLCTAQL